MFLFCCYTTGMWFQVCDARLGSCATEQHIDTIWSSPPTLLCINCKHMPRKRLTHLRLQTLWDTQRLKVSTQITVHHNQDEIIRIMQEITTVECHSWWEAFLSYSYSPTTNNEILGTLLHLFLVILIIQGVVFVGTLPTVCWRKIVTRMVPPTRKPQKSPVPRTAISASYANWAASRITLKGSLTESRSSSS